MATPDNLELRQRLLLETRADLLKRQLSNAENYDKAVLTLSTAALGFSVGFLKDFVSIASAKLSCTLYWSWIVLIGAIIATIVSFITSQRGLVKQLAQAEEYYLGSVGGDLPPRPLSARLTDCLNYTSGLLFIVGIVLTTIFAGANI